ncbi:MAG: hypothetical protein KME03_17680 [Aphanocapsa lilacina HA4352-LM1]|jgi:hypothetical protein|nr:hypothetical protein [Aphanocapsa lilacina HA4352-LM1]
MLSAHNLRSIAFVLVLAAVSLDVSIAWLALQGSLEGDSAFADIVFVTVVAWKLCWPIFSKSLRLEKKAALQRLEKAYRGF